MLTLPICASAHLRVVLICASALSPVCRQPAAGLHVGKLRPCAASRAIDCTSARPHACVFTCVRPRVDVMRPVWCAEPHPRQPSETPRTHRTALTQTPDAPACGGGREQTGYKQLIVISSPSSPSFSLPLYLPPFLPVLTRPVSTPFTPHSHSHTIPTSASTNPPFNPMPDDMALQRIGGSPARPASSAPDRGDDASVHTLGDLMRLLQKQPLWRSSRRMRRMLALCVLGGESC